MNLDKGHRGILCISHIITAFLEVLSISKLKISKKNWRKFGGNPLSQQKFLYYTAFNKYLLHTYYVMGTNPGIWGYQ